MKTIESLPILLLLFVSTTMSSCFWKKNLKDLDYSKKLSGVVIDSLTRLPIANATISIIRTSLSSQDQEEVKIVKTASNGIFHVPMEWDEVYIRVHKKGFEAQSTKLMTDTKEQITQLTFVLKGMPNIYTEFIKSTHLNYSKDEKTQVVVEVRDLFNETTNKQTRVAIHFYDLKSKREVVRLDLSHKAATNHFSLLKAALHASTFPKVKQGFVKEYGYYYKVIDPDNNFFQHGSEKQNPAGIIKITG